MRDYSKYIGTTFKRKGRTLEAIDCYGLIMLLYKEFQGIDIPDVDSPTSPQDVHCLTQSEQNKWVPCELEEGAVILFNILGYGAHVAYYIGDDMIIHASESVGSVVIERLSFTWNRRIMGIYKWPTQTTQ